MAAQTLQPTVWVIVDTGSSDGTLEVARELATEWPWIEIREIRIGEGVMRGGPIVRAFHFALESVPATCAVIAKVDADTSFDPDYFHRLIAAFEQDPWLGIAGGTGYEQQPDGAWRQRHGTGSGVWGASRAYRRRCLDEILPLEERMGWDTIDLVGAEVRGWKTRALEDLPFLHHRAEGERDPSRLSAYVKVGEAAHYMGYRLPYLAIRTVFRAFRDPSAIAIPYGYLRAARRQERRCLDVAVRESVRDHQRLSRLHLRAREALRPRNELGDPLSTDGPSSRT
jgi:glycosyltransferase involved in cell wall biosynthesis